MSRTVLSLILRPFGLTWMVHYLIGIFTICIYYVNEDGLQLRVQYTVYDMSDHYTFRSFFRPSVDMDFGLSRGRPRARLHTKEAHTPRALLTPNRTV